MKRLIITIPAKNEEKTLPFVIREIYDSIKHLNYNWKIIVVDDNSSDRTADVCKAMNVECFSLKRSSGLASVFRKEMEECLRLNADIIVHTDADGQYDATEIPKLLAMVEEGYDLVLGSRFLGTIEDMPLIKRIGNKAFSRVISQITGQKITDGQTGFRAFTTDVARNIKITSTHTYTQEQVIKASLLQYKVIEIPVQFRKRLHGKSRLIKSPLEYAFKAWINILRVYRDYESLKFFGIIGVSLIILAMPLIIRLLYFHFKTGISGHIFSMILAMILLISGLQIILFGFLADMRR